VEPLSLDEAFLDVGGATRLFGSPSEIGRAIRAEVAREVGVTCSVGVAPTKFVAKLASDERKPDGMHVVPVGGVRAYLDPLPAERLWGVGAKTLEQLHRIGVRTIGDIAATPRTILARLLGDAQATHLTELSHGRDDRDVVPYEAPKSVSHEETFERDLDAEQDILREALHLAGRVGHRLRTEGFRARTVTLKVRLATFQTLSRSRTLPDATDIAADLYRVACELYRALPGQRRRVRLLGVAATGLESAGAEQLALLHGDRWGDVERALDRIESRFGSGSAMPAALLDRGRDLR
jgi:DNA polymerase-4